MTRGNARLTDALLFLLLSSLALPCYYLLHAYHTLTYNLPPSSPLAHFTLTLVLSRTRPPVTLQTFGLKNKNKSSKVQGLVKTLQQQEAQRGKGQAEKDKQKEKDALAARKAAEQRKKDEVNSLFTPAEMIQQPKVPFGVGMC